MRKMYWAILLTATHLFIHLVRQIGNTYFTGSTVCPRDAKTSKLDKVSALKMITVQRE